MSCRIAAAMGPSLAKLAGMAGSWLQALPARITMPTTAITCDRIAASLVHPGMPAGFSVVRGSMHANPVAGIKRIVTISPAWFWPIRTTGPCDAAAARPDAAFGGRLRADRGRRDG